MGTNRTTAIIVAAGIGKRMGKDIPKQYLLLQEKPILYYAIKAFEESSVEKIILVVDKENIEYCRKEIVEKYNLKKVMHITEGGKERYHSVYNGLMKVKEADYVLVHDGARPFISTEIIENTIKEVITQKACIVGVPSKDTIKLVNSQGIVFNTPNRDTVWSIQTPQAFSYDLILQAYNKIMELSKINSTELPNITDDAMIVEYALNYPVRLVMGSYRNIKITTPEDLIIGEAFLKKA